MRFTRLRINGFKSFVDPTELVIADGLTGVVGPNGCGKSNLLEALRWVMGENRASAMRGAEMEDVIFAGSAARPPRSFAEVALSVDNSERLAPAGFNDRDLIEIVRRITREAGSSYKVNQRDVRARDVQLLFADASTGAHSPALVRQGQIAELIAARPRARRAILEEAAGISGLHARRHEAALKLNATEANLARVADIAERLAQQLAQLARQVRQAARYREIGAELRRAAGMLLWRRWHDAEAERLAAGRELGARLAAAGMAGRLAREAAVAREAADAALPPLREEAAVAGAVLQRLAAEREQLDLRQEQAHAAIRTAADRIVQLESDGAREEALNRDAGETMSRLRAEETALRAAGEGHAARLVAAAAAMQAAEAELDRQEEARRRLTDAAARLAARHQSAQRLVGDSRRLVARGEAEVAAARGQLQAAEAVLAGAGAEIGTAAAAVAEAQRLAASAEQVLAESERARAATQAREAEARAQRSGAEGELNALAAEAAALTRLLDRDKGTGGQVLDLLSVAPGLELAIGAALADDLRAPLVSDARRSGWVELPDYAQAQPLPPGIVPLATAVSVPPALSRRIAQVGLVAAAEGATRQAELGPGQRLVSAEGDLWRWDGLRAAAADAPSAAALRLRQINRIEALKQEQARTEALARAAAQAHEVLRARLGELTEADRRAREARREADRRLGEATRRLSHLEAERTIAAGKVESLRLALARHEDDASDARLRLAEAEASLASLPDLAACQAEADRSRASVEAARTAMLARRGAHDETRRDGEARERRLAALAGELAGWQGRLDSAGQRIAELVARRDEAAAELAAARGLPEVLSARREELLAALAAGEARRARAADALAEGEEARRVAALAEREAEGRAGEARESRARAEALATAATAAAAEAEGRITEELGTTPGALIAQLAADPGTVPDAGALEIEVNRLKRQRDALGAVNLRADEDAREIQAEHDRLVAEKADLEQAIARLRTGIGALNREGRERLLTAFEQVNANFARLFRHLFGGGEARLTLVESDDPLEAGLEILCQPPGKKLAVLSLLSGGEQTLTALAMIFAVFLANPAPICVLDEVDAPLDDANVGRFCDLLDEMTRTTDTRFLVITHHAVTMARMHRLFGVTMGEKGVSQLVSVDLRRAEALVA